ncbi:MAG TPA: hypothetical protein VM680_02795 [Verrucomicrobiae bacterium]|nr:hypothetical protein [Verrucomicrobiae bacterium]
MKTFLGLKNKTIDRNTAMGLAGINLLATPGLGTILAGRIFVGAIQLALAGAGFLLVLKWFYGYFTAGLNGTVFPPGWEWQLGLLLFATAWLASLWSSLNLIRAAPRQTPPPLPPKLDGSPG